MPRHVSNGRPLDGGYQRALPAVAVLVGEEGEQVVEAVKEAIEICERSGAPLEISHHKVIKKSVWQVHCKTTIALIDQARRRGLDVKADQYPFNILTEYSKQMTAEGNKTVISDLNYILTQLPEDQRVALVNAVYQLIEQAKAGTLGGNAG